MSAHGYGDAGAASATQDTEQETAAAQAAGAGAAGSGPSQAAPEGDASGGPSSPFSDPFGPDEVRPERDEPSGRPFWGFDDPTPAADPRAACVLIGPPGAGKTSFLLATGRALQMSGDGAADVRLVPDERAAAEMGVAARQLATGEALGAGRPSALHFGLDLRLDRGWRPTGAMGVDLRLKELPGDDFLPPDLETLARRAQWRSRWIAEARGANCLALAVDAARPRSDLWCQSLPAVLEALLRGDSERRRAGGFYRILVVLNRIDRLCEKAAAAAAREVRADHLPRYSPLALALAIDPADQARELLGTAALKALSDVLAPAGTMAVGLASAGGFDADSGEALLDESGTPRRSVAAGGEEVLGRWMPFGVREAIFFLAGGRTGGSLVSVSRAEIFSQAGRRSS